MAGDAGAASRGKIKMTGKEMPPAWQALAATGNGNGVKFFLALSVSRLSAIVKGLSHLRALGVAL